MASLYSFVLQFSSGLYAVMTPIAVAGEISLARRSSLIFMAMGIWWLAYVAIFIVTGAFGPYPWYFAPLLPAYFMCIAAAIEQAIRIVWRRPVPAAAAATCVVVAAVALGSRLPRLRSTLDGWFEGREYLYRDVAMNVLTRHDCTLAATEIGALGYFYPGPILDLVGLVSPEVTAQPLESVFTARTPCWLVSYDTHLPPELMPGSPLIGNYSVLFRRRVGPKRELLVFRRQ